MKKVYLEVPREAGGLGLPNFLWYYWSANIIKCIHWRYTYDYEEGPDWVHMELLSNPLPMLTSPLPSNRTISPTNPVVKASLRIWLQFRKHFGLNQLSTRYFPVANNQFFPPSVIDKAFQHWHRNGLTTLSDLFWDDTFLSFETLVTEHDIPRSHFFRFLQVRSFTQKMVPSFPYLPPKNQLDILLQLSPNEKKTCICDLRPVEKSKTSNLGQDKSCLGKRSGCRTSRGDVVGQFRKYTRLIDVYTPWLNPIQGNTPTSLFWG